MLGDIFNEKLFFTHRFLRINIIFILYIVSVINFKLCLIFRKRIFCNTFIEKSSDFYMTLVAIKTKTKNMVVYSPLFARFRARGRLS